MKTTVRIGSVSSLLLAWLAIAGCGTPSVNPSSPRADTGYVDFYTDSNMELSWDVKCADERTGEMRTVFSEFDPVKGNILRLAAPPGNRRFEVWFINRATEGPLAVSVEVQDGKVIPVHIALNPAGTASTDRKSYRFGGSAKGYARGTKTVSDTDDIYKIETAVGLPQAYEPKERMSYWSLARK